MTQSEFIAECAERLIDPALALENETIVNALKMRDDEAVIYALEEEF